MDHLTDVDMQKLHDQLLTELKNYYSELVLQSHVLHVPDAVPRALVLMGWLDELAGAYRAGPENWHPNLHPGGARGFAVETRAAARNTSELVAQLRDLRLEYVRSEGAGG